MSERRVAEESYNKFRELCPAELITVSGGDSGGSTRNPGGTGTTSPTQIEIIPGRPQTVVNLDDINW